VKIIGDNACSEKGGAEAEQDGNDLLIRRVER
jgi:hypothetical protein